MITRFRSRNGSFAVRPLISPSRRSPVLCIILLSAGLVTSADCAPKPLILVPAAITGAVDGDARAGEDAAFRDVFKVQGKLPACVLGFGKGTHQMQGNSITRLLLRDTPDRIDDLDFRALFFNGFFYTFTQRQIGRRAAVTGAKEAYGQGIRWVKTD